MWLNAREFNIYNCPCPCCYGYRDCLNMDIHKCQKRLNTFYKNRHIKKENIKSDCDDFTDSCWSTVNGKDVIEFDIPIGRLCCFRPIDKNSIYFGHVAGKVIDDFENMTFMCVVKCDDKYYFSREVIEKPKDVYASKDAEKYFR